MIAVIAKIPIQAERAEIFEQAARTLEENVGKHEDGCLLYRMTKSRETPNLYMNMELYRDQAALDLHQQTEYFKQALQVFGTCLGGVPEVAFYDTAF